MDFLLYYILFTNEELADCEIQFQDLSTLEDPPGDTVAIYLTGSESPAIIDTPQLDDDKTKAIRGKRFRASFLSKDDYDIDGTPGTVDVETFSDGVEGRFLTRITTDTLALPFLGNIVLDDNVEAFQPKANVVTLSAGCGLGILRDIELTESDGDIPIDHYRIIDYITLCLRHLAPSQDIHVVFNKFELDTDPDVTHAFFDAFLEARTFETDIDGRDDCYTVLEKILDAFGCFITYDQDGWWIISWDEYDKLNGGVTTLRTGHFNSDGAFIGYTDVAVDKIVAHDGDPEYEGYRLSMDNALRRFQRKAGSLKHVYRFEQPREIPCNSSFTRGTVDDDVLPLKTYDPDCWSLFRGWGANGETPNSEMKIWVRFDANDNEEERYLTLTPQASSGGEFNYARSEAIPIDIKDKFEFEFSYSADTDNSTDGPATIGIGCLVLYGFDNSVWILGDNISSPGDPSDPEWKLSDEELSTNFDYYQWFFSASSGSEDYTDFQTYSIEAPPAPVAGNLYVHLFAAGQTGTAIDNFVIRYNSLQFTYIPFINGSYERANGQEHKVTGDDDSRKTIDKPMFISDSPKPLFKGALKKFDGTNYVLTETWNYYNDTGVLSDTPLAKHILFQWWNQFRKTRTVIETDLQGLRSTEEFGIPSLINRWTILHGGQEDKYFMLTSIPMMDFRTCGWRGVFVEMSDEEGDRNYDDTYQFKFIQ